MFRSFAHPRERIPCLVRRLEGLSERRLMREVIRELMREAIREAMREAIREANREAIREAIILERFSEGRLTKLEVRSDTLRGISRGNQLG